MNMRVMNMLSQMDRLPCTCLMMFCLFISIYGGGEDLFPSCKVGLLVRRRTAWKSAPQQSVTLNCPVKHCGNSLNISWCKLVNTDSCEQITKTENVEISDSYVKDELISKLTFKRINVSDDGLYRCDLKGYKYGLISHSINISVSDLYNGVEKNNYTDNIEVSLITTADKTVSWLPYFYICAAIVFLVVTLTMFTHLHSYCWKRKLTFKPTKAQEISTQMIPGLPKGSVPSAPVLEPHYYSPSTAGTPASAPSQLTSGNQHLANRADESCASDGAVYAVINLRQSGKPANKHHDAAKQDKNSEYAAISVS